MGLGPDLPVKLTKRCSPAQHIEINLLNAPTAEVDTLQVHTTSISYTITNKQEHDKTSTLRIRRVALHQQGQLTV